jgi:hypothetical protein
MKVGEAPIIRAKIRTYVNSELMFVQYLPIKFPYSSIQLPNHVKPFWDIVDSADRGFPRDHYVYLTAKHLYVVPGDVGNRPGWHTDGFGSEDINFIWYDTMPTEFCVQDFNISDEHEQSMIDMEAQAKPENIVTYEPGSVLELNNKVVHRTAICTEGHYRTFVKISVSKNLYNLRGNAHNYLFDYNWPMVERAPIRNHTSPE